MRGDDMGDTSHNLSETIFPNYHLHRARAVWVNDPLHEGFIKSNITELIQSEFKNEFILPPIPQLMRKEYITRQKKRDEPQTE